MVTAGLRLYQLNISRSHSHSNTGDTTITRLFPIDEDEFGDGEETETGAETEDDYHDARLLPEDYHSLRDMTVLTRRMFSNFCFFVL